MEDGGSFSPSCPCSSPGARGSQAGRVSRWTDAAGTCTQAKPKEPQKARARLRGKVTQKCCQAANPKSHRDFQTTASSQHCPP